MPDINDIHKFFEVNLPGYQRKHNLECIRFFLEQAGYSIKKPIKTFLRCFQELKDFVCWDWQGEEINQSTAFKKKDKKKKMIHNDKLTDSSLMPYGKHMGEKMANVPPDYLLWLYENDKCNQPVRDYIVENKAFLELERKSNKKNESR